MEVYQDQAILTCLFDNTLSKHIFWKLNFFQTSYIVFNFFYIPKTYTSLCEVMEKEKEILKLFPEVLLKDVPL